MPPKDMKAFLAKQTKGKKTQNKDESKDMPKVEENTNKVQQSKNAPVQEDHDSDSAESESDIIANRAKETQFKEAKEQEKQDEDKKKGFGLDENKEVTEAKQDKKVFGQGPMNFSRPKFTSKKAGQFAKGEFASLDELEEGDSPSKTKQNTDSGQKEFVNLGAQPKSYNKNEEESKGEKAEPQRPRFKGKLNLAGTGSQPAENSEGVTKEYGFGVVYKQPHGPDGEKKEHTKKNFGDIYDNKDGPREERKGGFKGKRERGQEWGKGRRDDNEDEGFEVVKKQERRHNKKKNQDDSDSSDEDTKGKGNRGGFFRNSGGDRGGDRGRGGRSFPDADGEGFVYRGRGGNRGDRGGFKRSEGETVGGARVERGGNRGDRGGFRNQNKD